MAFDTLHDWCVGLERDLDPVARLSHWIGHAPDPWQVEAFTTQASEIALRVGRQAGKTSVLAARAAEELHVPDSLTICVAPAERQGVVMLEGVTDHLADVREAVARAGNFCPSAACNARGVEPRAGRRCD